MKPLNFKALTLAVCVGATLSLAACGSDNDDNNSTANPAPASTETIKGTAATGKPFVGKIVVKNKDGKESTAVDIKLDGTFEVAAPKGGPYLIKAYNDKTGDQAVTLYSYSMDAKTQVNVNQLTTQAIFAANGQASLDALYKDWDKQNSVVTAAKVEDAAKKVAANLSSQFAAVSIDAKKLNIFSYEFKANGSGFDAVLDKVQISGFSNCNVSSCNVKYMINGSEFSWNYQISTTGYSWVVDGGGIPGSGQNCLVDVDVKVAGQNVSQKVCYSNFPTNTVCGAANGALGSALQVFSSGIGGVSATYTFSAVGSCPAGATVVAWK